MSVEEFVAHVEVFFKLHRAEAKYRSDDNIKAIVTRMCSYGLTVASHTMVKRALSELVAENKIQRADGGDEHTDKLAAAMAERKRLEQIAAAPLTEREFDQFVRLMPAELEQKYYSDKAFAVRYDKACREFGFKKPLPPKQAPLDIPAESDPSEYRDLTAREYHSIPALRTARLYQSDPGFKRAVDRLIREGQL